MPKNREVNDNGEPHNTRLRDENGHIDDAPWSSHGTSEKVDLLIIAAMAADPFQTAREIRDLSLDICEDTIRRRLNFKQIRSASLTRCNPQPRAVITQLHEIAQIAAIFCVLNQLEWQRQ